MFRKIILISSIIALGLAIFAGCSNDNAVIDSMHSYEWDYLTLEGRVYLEGVPYEGAYVEYLINGEMEEYDYTDANGFYGIYETGGPTKSEFAVRCTVPEPLTSPKTTGFERPPHDHEIDFYVYYDAN